MTDSAHELLRLWQETLIFLSLLGKTAGQTLQKQWILFPLLNPRNLGKESEASRTQADPQTEKIRNLKEQRDIDRFPTEQKVWFLPSYSQSVPFVPGTSRDSNVSEGASENWPCHMCFVFGSLFLLAVHTWVALVVVSMSRAGKNKHKHFGRDCVRVKPNPYLGQMGPVPVTNSDRPRNKPAALCLIASCLSLWRVRPGTISESPKRGRTKRVP